MTDIETAKAVAEACGWTRHKMFTIYGGGGFGIYLGDYWRTFNPVQRLDDAFFAAEAAGLFRQGASLWEFDPGVWEICFRDDESFVRAETPAKAICAAILAMHAATPR